MRRLKIGFDVDDVLFDFYPSFCKKYNIELKPCDIWSEEESGVTPEKLNSLDGEFWGSLNPIFNISEIEFEIDCYLTSFPKKYLMNRIENMLSHKLPVREFICCSSSEKLNYIIEKEIDIFVDDNPNTIKMIRDANTKCVPIQLLPPYSTTELVKNVLVVKNYKELNNLLKK